MDLQYFPMDRQLCYIEIESCKCYCNHFHRYPTRIWLLTKKTHLGVILLSMFYTFISTSKMHDYIKHFRELSVLKRFVFYENKNKPKWTRIYLPFSGNRWI